MGFQLLANVRVDLPKGRLSSLGHGSSSSVAQELMGLSHRNTTAIFFLATFFFLFSVSCQLD